jgi:hypothetical protein
MSACRHSGRCPDISFRSLPDYFSKDDVAPFGECRMDMRNIEGDPGANSWKLNGKWAPIYRSLFIQTRGVVKKQLAC